MTKKEIEIGMNKKKLLKMVKRTKKQQMNEGRIKKNERIYVKIN